MSSRHNTPSGSRKSSSRNIGQFVIDKEIGKGSFAQVYMGWHKVRWMPVISPSSSPARRPKAAASYHLLPHPTPNHPYPLRPDHPINICINDR